jgi:hypothetical protein
MNTRTVLLLLLGWSSLASASGVYKWVDEQGRVHYGERPPARAQAQEMQIKEAPLEELPVEDDGAARSDKTQRLLRAFEEEREQKKAQQQKQRDEQEKRQRNCALARDRLRRYQNASSLYNLDKQGERHALSDAERTASEQSAQQEVARWCN